MQSRHSAFLPGKGPFSGCCFLVAEDNAINAEILCELLGLCGAETVLMTDGAKAVKAFQDTEPETYDAILMDIQMPKMNGYDAARAIRGMETGGCGGDTDYCHDGQCF